jgi:TetR/AcrR family transcriptional regulator
MLKNKAIEGPTEPIPPASRRPRDGAQTRLALLAAAREEFAAKGFAGTRVDEVAERAGVNKQVIYHHFGNKDGLFRATLEAGYEQVHSKNSAYAESAAGLGPVEGVRHLIEHLFDRFLRHPEMVELILEENRQKGKHLIRKDLITTANEPLISHVRRLLREGEEQGMFLPRQDAKQFLFDVISMCMFYFANVHTMSAVLQQDLATPASMRKRRAHIATALLRSISRKEQ